MLKATKRLLVTTTAIGAIANVWNADTGAACTNGGGFISLVVQAVHNKAKIEIDDEISGAGGAISKEKAEACKRALIKKLQEVQKAVEEAEKEKLKKARDIIVAGISAQYGRSIGLRGVGNAIDAYAATAKYAAGTIGAVLEGGQQDQSFFVRVLRWLDKYDHEGVSERLNGAMSGLIESPRFIRGAIENAVRAGVSLKDVAEALSCRAGEIIIADIAAAANIGCNAAQLAQLSGADERYALATARLEKIANVAQAAIDNSGSQEMLKAVYKNQAKKELFPVGEIVKKLSALRLSETSKTKVDKSSIDLVDGKGSRKATGFAGGIEGGYLIRNGDMTITPVIGAYFIGGKALKVGLKNGKKGDPYAKIKTKGKINLGLHIGRFVTPSVELFGGAGLSVGFHETDPTGLVNTVLTGTNGAFVQIAEDYNSSIANSNENAKNGPDAPIVIPEDNEEDNKQEEQKDNKSEKKSDNKNDARVCKKASKTAFAPYFELGARVHLDGGMFISTKVGYEPRHNIGKPKKTGIKVKQESMYASFGFGMLFGG